jgi:hypothetical protein
MRQMDRLLEKLMSDLPDLKLLKNKPPQLGMQYHFASLPQCVVGAVFSDEADPETELAAVDAYCGAAGFEQKGWPRFSEHRVPLDKQQSIISMLGMYQQARENGAGFDDISMKFFGNTRKTREQKGPLCAEAAYNFAEALAKVHFCTTLDVHAFHLSPIRKHELDRMVRGIPGLEDRNALHYFYMLSGNEWHVRADRALLEFLSGAGIIIEKKDPVEADRILHRVHDRLAWEYPHATPRALYDLIRRTLSETTMEKGS